MTMNIVRRNNVKVFGNGKEVLMFAHGFGCDQTMWRYITPAFEEYYKIVLFDYVGCGKSDIEQYNTERYNTLHGYALDILDVCQELQLKNIVFVGHSVSAMIGLLASTQDQELFQNLILICPSPCYINQPDYFGGFEKKDLEGLMDIMENNYVGWSSLLAPVVMKNSDVPELTEELEKSFCSMDKEITQNFARVTFFSDNREDLPKIKVPSLILQCSQDDIANDKVGMYVHRHLPKSTMNMMKATGHCPHMSHPEETIQCIEAYLSPA